MLCFFTSYSPEEGEYGIPFDFSFVPATCSLIIPRCLVKRWINMAGNLRHHSDAYVDPQASESLIIRPAGLRPRATLCVFLFFGVISVSKMSSISPDPTDRDLFSGRSTGPPFLDRHRFCRCLVKRWLERRGFCSSDTREEMDQQTGWDSCDIILVTGDAYVDHPSFGMAICGRMLEAQGFRVGIIAQQRRLYEPDWSSKDDFVRMHASG